MVRPKVVDRGDVMMKRIDIKKILLNPALRKRLLDGTIRATIAIGRDNTRPVRPSLKL